MRIAVVPARGGSKRIPGKNIKLFAGQPILAYSLKAAAESKLFDDIIVSTDAEDIAAVARQYGASVPFMRPKNLSDDYTGTNAVVKHAVEWCRSQGREVTQVCCIYSTAPFLTPEILRTGYQLMIDSGKSYVFSATSFAFPVQRALVLKGDGGVEPMFPRYAEYRSQDLEEAYHDAGQFYWGQAQAFVDEVPVYSTAANILVLPRHLVQDIDTMEDWYCAELMYSAWQNMNP